MGATRSRRLLASPMILCLCLTAANAARPRVAVIGSTNTHQDKRLATGHQRLADNLEAALLNTGRFDIVVRHRLEALLQEKRLAREGLISDPFGSVAALKGAGVDYLVLGSLEGDADATKAIARFVPVTGAKAGTIEYAFESVGVTVPYVGYLAYQMAQSAQDTFRLHWPPQDGKVARVESVTDDVLTLNLGTQDAVLVGDEFIVQAAPDTPATTAFQEMRDIARVRILKVQDGGSKAQIEERLDPNAAVAAGMGLAPAPPRTSGGKAPARRLVVGTPRTIAPASPDVDGGWFASVLTSELTNKQAAMDSQVLEREHIGEIYEEFRRTESPVFNWEQAVRAGGLFGANILVTTTIGKTGGRFQVSARLDELDDGRTLLATTRTGQELQKLAAEVAGDVADFLRPAELRALGAGQVKGAVTFNYDQVPTGQYVCLPRTADLVTYSLKNVSPRTLTLRLTTELEGFCQPFAREITLRPQESRELGATPPLDSSKVAALSDAVHASLHCRMDLLTGGETKILDDSHEVTLLPRNTWVAQLQLRQLAETVDTTPTISAWIEQSAPLNTIRGRAAALCSLKGLVGYQANFLGVPGWEADTPQERRSVVLRQVKAVYDALRELGIRYLDQPVTASAHSGQRVLRPDQVIATKGANCLDGAVLFAAALAPTIRPILVMTDTHALVGWQTWSNWESPWDVLETTQLGTADFDTALKRGQEEAHKVGLTALLEGKSEKLEFGDLGLPLVPPPAGVKLIDVRKAREFYETMQRES